MEDEERLMEPSLLLMSLDEIELADNSVDSNLLFDKLELLLNEEPY